MGRHRNVGRPSAKNERARRKYWSKSSPETRIAMTKLARMRRKARRRGDEYDRYENVMRRKNKRKR